MAKVPDHLRKYYAAFEQHFSQVDEVAQSVLKGHLVIEQALDNILATMFFHPEHIALGRFTFAQKVNIARAFCLRKDKLSPWQQILALNSLRNEIAHNLESEERTKKMDRVR